MASVSTGLKKMMRQWERHDNEKLMSAKCVEKGEAAWATGI